MPTILTAGDLAILDFNTNANPVSFRLVALTNIDSGTEIKITDRGWTGTGFFSDINSTVTEGTITWTVDTSITAGATFQFTNTSDPMGPGGFNLIEVATGTDRTGELGLLLDGWEQGVNFNADGDQLLIYTGDDNSPTFIYALSTEANTAQDNEWHVDTDPSSDPVDDDTESQLPTGLTNGTEALALTKGLHKDNYAYNGPTTQVDKATWLSRLSDSNHWTGDDAQAQTGTVSATELDPNAVLAITTSASDPAITEAGYDAGTGVLTVTGTNFVADSGDDVDVSKLSLTGDGVASYTLTSANVEITSATSFAVTLNGTDRTHVGGLLNKNGTQAADTTAYSLAAAAGWMSAAATVADTSGNGVSVSGVTAPTISSATYDVDSGTLMVTGANFINEHGATNDVDVSAFTLTGDNSGTRALTSTDVEITSATSFTISLNSADQTAVNALLNKNGATSNDNTIYNLAAADNWMPGVDTNTDITSATNGITVSNLPAPAITAVTYNAGSNTLTVTGTNFVTENGGNNDIDISKLTFTGEGGASYTLTSASDVEIASATEFTVTLSGSDLTTVEALLNRDGTAALSTTDYNLALADDWMAGADSATDIASATNGITVSGYTGPVIDSAAYNFSTGTLVLTGSNFVSNSAGDDVDSTKLTLTGEGDTTYTLTADTSNVNIDSDSQITVTLGATDKLHVNGLLNKAGPQADDLATDYNLAAAEDWLTGAAQALVIADLNSTVTVSNYAAPTIDSATYDPDSGVLNFTGTNLVKAPGDTNDIDLSNLTLAGNGSYQLTSASDVEISSGTSFSVTLTGVDKTGVDAVLDQLGTSASDSTPYNILAADNWLTGAPASANIIDNTANTITVKLPPQITSATYNANTGALVVTGSNIQQQAGSNNDIDASKLTLTGEGGESYTLVGTPDVDRTSATEFTLMLDTTDKSKVNQLLNKNSTASTGGTSFNLAAGDDWNLAVTDGDSADATNTVTVSGVAAPQITDADYDAGAGTLTVTGTGFTKRDGQLDIDVSMLTLTGESGATHALSSSTDVEISSDTSFVVTLDASDKAAVNQILNKDGTASTNNTSYNLAAAEDWACGADANETIADLTANAVTVSNIPAPTITSATYNAVTGTLVVTGSNFVKADGAANDIDVSKLVVSAGPMTNHTLTSNSVEISSGTQFTVNLNDTDKAAVAPIIANATSASTFNLIANEDWAAGAAAAVDVADTSGNSITILNNAPTASDGSVTANYNGSYTFKASDFSFSDADSGDSLDHITLKSLPANGSLTLNNTAVTVNQNIAANDIANLVFTPASGGTGSGSGSGYAIFTFTVNDGADDSATPNTLTLDVAAPPTPPTPTTSPELPTTKIIDGTEVTSQTEKDSDGNQVTTLTIAARSNDGQDTDTANPGVNIVIGRGGAGDDYVTAGDGDDIDDDDNDGIQLGLGNGVGAAASLTTLDIATSGDSTAPVPDEIVKSVENRIDQILAAAFGNNDSGNQTASRMSSALASNSQTDQSTGQTSIQVATIKPTVNTSATSTGEDGAQAGTPSVSISGTSSSNSNTQQQAVILDTSALQSGATVNIDNVSVVAVTNTLAHTANLITSLVAPTPVTPSAPVAPAPAPVTPGPVLIQYRGGQGDNTFLGGSASDDVKLGPGDDKLYGGDGNDIVGSEGGDDQIFGENGNDTLFGGAGKDTLHGGRDIDKVTYEGNQADYELTQNNGVITVTSKADSTDSDTLINVEQITFADGNYLVHYDTELKALATLYQNVLGRQADLAGFQWWAEQLDNDSSFGETILSFMQSSEYQGLQGQSFTELDNGQQLDALYQAVLGRAADDAGKAYWLASLDTGMNILEVAHSFAGSAELLGQAMQSNQWDFSL